MVVSVLAESPQCCLRVDRAATLARRSLPEADARLAETRGGLAVIDSGETRAGARRFAGGAGRHGRFED